MNAQNTQNPDLVHVPEAGQASTSVSRRTQVLTAAVVVSALTPAAYLGMLSSIAIAQWADTSGPGVSIILVGITGVILSVLGSIAFAVASRWPKGGALVNCVAVLGLSGLSAWMLTTMVEAQEALMVFGITVVVLALMAALMRLFKVI